LNEIRSRVQQINGVAETFECQFGVIDLSKILCVKGFDLSRVLEMDPSFLETQDHQVRVIHFNSYTANFK
jgi:G3E family GTPase